MSSSNTGSEVILAPNSYPKNSSLTTIFLSGSMGTSGPNWRTTLTSHLASLPVRILDPSRPDWESLGPESMDSPKWVEQVTWELDGIDAADIVVVHFGAEPKAPISLLELGLAAKSGRCIVCIKEGYWKQGNVRLFCQRLGIDVVWSVEELGKPVEKMVMDVEGEKTTRKEKLEGKFEGVSSSDLNSIQEG